MAGQASGSPVAEFCAGLKRLVQDRGLDRAALARQLGYSRSQLYEILDGRISRPPEWDRLVEPLVRACTGNDEREVGSWRRRHDVLVAVYTALKHQHRSTDLPGPLAPPRVVPAQLPPAVEVFTGRSQELAALDRLLKRTADQAVAAQVTGGDPTAVVISAVSGTAGVGKTELALRWAHRVRGDFPDGQLYVNLRGFDPEQPLSAADALAGFLRALGLAGQSIPVEVEERAAAYRSLLDGRRMLVVLDNAASVEQVRPLLPGTPSCVVVVTSRDSMAGLVARHGARRLDLDLLLLEDAVALLAALIGERVQAEPEAAAALAQLCARLPLALRVAAELAAARPAITLAQLVGELADEQLRLELLDAGGDARTAVRGVFSWSYRHLTAAAARTFRLIGLHPGPDFDSYAVAALVDTSLAQAQQIVDLLARARLIRDPRPGRYGMHDLLRAYATHLADVEDSEVDRRAALTRLFDHYLAAAAAAMDALIPAEQHRRPRIPPPATPTPPMPDPATARAWLDAERVTLTAVSAYSAAYGWPGHTTHLSTTLYRYLDFGGHFLDGLAIHTHALHSAQHVGDSAVEADALLKLGHIYWRQGHYHQAAERLQQALTLTREIGDRLGEARALNNLGIVYWRRGHYQRAADCHQQALDLFSEIGDRVGQAHALNNLGNVCRRQGSYQRAADYHQHALTLTRTIGGRLCEAEALTNLGAVYRRQGLYQQAADYHQQALDLFSEIGDRHGEARALTNLGAVYRQQGDYQQGIDHLQQALTLALEIGDQFGEADALINFGAVYRRQDQDQQAADYYQQALDLFRKIGDQHGEACTLNRVGETLVATRQPDQALGHHATALTLANQIGDRYEQARAHNGLAHAHQAADDLDQARHHWQHALDLYTDLGVPDAEEVRDCLTVLDQVADGSNADH
ncbi:MAG: ATP-binding protein [Pseudonocardiaceae bacterium]